jgi:hypothetical protein
MKFHLLFLAMISSIAAVAQPTASSELYPIRDHGKYGFMSNTGDIVIPVIYDDADFFYEGLAAVKLNGKYGFIDNKNKMVIEPQFDSTSHFSEGFCAIANRDDQTNIPGLQWGYINSSGDVLNLTDVPALGLATDFHNNRAIVSPLGFDEPVLINKSGNVVVRQGEFYFFQDPNIYFREGMMKVMKMTGPGSYQTQFIDTNGKVLSQFSFDYPDIGQFNEGFAWFYKDLKYGFLDKTGKEVIPAQYDTVLDFSEGWARVSQRMDLNSNTARLEGGIHGYINHLGEWTLQPKARMGYSFSNGYARVFENGKWGFMNTNGTMVIPAEYDKAEDFMRGMARVQKGEQWFYINLRGKIVWSEPIE